MTKLKIGRYVVETSNEAKILFPKSKITKGDLIEYYKDIADTMLTYVKNRPISMVRYPNGIDKEGFYQKDAPDYFPKWIVRFEIKKKTGGVTNYVVINNEATLVYVTNQGCITPHIWLSKKDKPDYPDMIVFDIDPPDLKSFAKVRHAALLIKEALEEDGLTPFVKTTGSKGLHVVVPIKRTVLFDIARSYTQQIAKKLIDQEPKQFTLEFRKEKRNNKVLIDTFRNAFAQTMVAPFGVRPKEGAPISMPIAWKEVHSTKLSSQSYTIKNVFTYLKKHGDHWDDMSDYAKSIKGLANR